MGEKSYLERLQADAVKEVNIVKCFISSPIIIIIVLVMLSWDIDWDGHLIFIIVLSLLSASWGLFYGFYGLHLRRKKEERDAALAKSGKSQAKPVKKYKYDNPPNSRLRNHEPQYDLYDPHNLSDKENGERKYR